MTGDVIKSRDGDFQFQRGALSQSEPRRVRWPYMNRLFYKGKMLHRTLTASSLKHCWYLQIEQHE
jgi:hypothetical protein